MRTMTTGSDTSAAEPGLVSGERDIVQLDPDHPGFRDPVYRTRRNAIAKLAFDYREGQRVPEVEYTPEEHQVWRTVWESLAPIQEQWACAEYLEYQSKLGLDRTRIPQLAEVNDRLKPLSGFSMIPVAGLVTDRTFLGRLEKSTFLSTQYMRHHSTPLYTPEPDVVHELVGHAATLAHPAFGKMNRTFGRAARLVTDAELPGIARVYWYTMEFGALREHGKVKAYGAGLLSSFGELGWFAGNAELRPLNPDEMAARPYDPTQYQNVVYVADSFAHMAEVVTAWLQAKTGVSAA